MHPTKLFLSSLLMICLMIAGIKAQNYQISFTGSGLSTTIDSVQVLNIAQGTSVTVKSTEGLQLIGTSTEIETHLHGKGNLHIYPNPMSVTSAIEFLSFRGSPVIIEVFDVTGKIVILEKQHLIQGNHRFEISGLPPGVYMINIFTCDGKYTGKLLSIGEYSDTPVIRYQGNNFSSAQKSVLKSTQSLVQMQYEDGERLLFKGFSGNYSRVLSLMPTQSQTVNLEFIACTDVAGKHYTVVTLGAQTWMAENLAYLPAVIPSASGSTIDPCYYVYDYQNTNVTEAKATVNYQKFGVLYNWIAAMNACPAGWHLPTDAEWTALENYLIASGYNYDGTTTGNKIAKSLAISGVWTTSTTAGTLGNTDYPDKRNVTGFSALPAGARSSNGFFGSSGVDGIWWSASEGSSSSAWYRGLGYFGSAMFRGSYSKGYGFSVRCLRD